MAFGVPLPPTSLAAGANIECSCVVEMKRQIGNKRRGAFFFRRTVFFCTKISCWFQLQIFAIKNANKQVVGGLFLHDRAFFLLLWSFFTRPPGFDRHPEISRGRILMGAGCSPFPLCWCCGHLRQDGSLPEPRLCGLPLVAQQNNIEGTAISWSRPKQNYYYYKG